MRRVYVAGPYSTGDTLVNVRRAIDAAEELLGYGFMPYIPHLNHLWHELYPHDWEEWLALDKEWLLLCDAVVRLPGDSRGADTECEWAKEAGIPVFGTISDLMDASYR